VEDRKGYVLKMRLRRKGKTREVEVAD